MSEGDFTIDGMWLGRPVRLRWRGGNVIGPAGFVDLMRFHAWLRANGAGPVGAMPTRALLTNSEATLKLASELMDRVDRVLSSVRALVEEPEVQECEVQECEEEITA